MAGAKVHSQNGARQQPSQARGGPSGQAPQRSGPGRFTLRRRMMARRSEVGICTKYILFFENFLLFLLGLASMAVGTYILVLKKKTVQGPLEFFLDPASDMCLAGALVFVLAFFGCMGALRENVCFLKLFYYSLCLFLFLEVGVAVCFFLTYYVESVRNALIPENTFKDAIVHYRDDADMRNLIDSLQSSLGCCGLSNTAMGYEDWNQNIYFNCNETTRVRRGVLFPHPVVGCNLYGQVINLNCGANIYTFEKGQRTVSDTSKIYTDGCLKALGDWVSDNSLVLGGVLLGIILPQIFIICLSRNLLDMINAQMSKWYQ